MSRAADWHTGAGRVAKLSLPLLLVALSLAVRLPALDRFVTPDELKWVCRSVNYYRGLQRGEFAQTLQTGHPGVITMWLGVPFMPIDPAEEWLDGCVNPSISDLIAASPRDFPASLAAILFNARRAVVWVTSLAIGAAYLLLARLFDRASALAIGFLIVFDPFFLAHSRFLHLDAIITCLVYLSVLLMILALRRDSRAALIGSGVLAGLAALNKSPAMVVGPFAVGTIAVLSLTRKRGVRRMARSIGIWTVSAVASYVLVWPAMWVRPCATFRTVLETALFYAGEPHTNSNFFWGLPRPDPGPAFYPIAILFRAPPWTLLGVAFSLPLFWQRERRRDALVLLATFMGLYVLFMTTGQKKFDRYVLPVFPILQTLAGVGIVAGWEWLVSAIRPRLARPLVAAVPVAIVTLLGVAMVLPHAPYYLTYYSPLVGGPRAAPDTMLVGWGEGLDEAARYLNENASSDAEASVRSLMDFSPFYRGVPVDDSDYDPATTDYVIVYVNEVQRWLSPELLDRYYVPKEPLHIVRIKGIDYAWIYENDTHQAIVDYINRNGVSGSDAIVVSRPSRFDRFYGGELPLKVLRPEMDREEVLPALHQATEGVDRIWYVRYWEKNPNPELEWLDWQWRAHAHLVEQSQFTDVDVYLWETRSGVPFASSQAERQDVGLRFGDALLLEGVTMATPDAQWGRDAGITLHWRVLRDLDKYYAEYVHVLDDAGRRWGQGDHWIVDESLVPTVSWRLGALVDDRVRITLSPGIPPGAYAVVAGVYDRIAKESLAIADEQGGSLGNRTVIGRLTVARSPYKPAKEVIPAQHPVDVELAPGVFLVGWGIDKQDPAFGESIAVSLLWHASAEPDDDYEVLVSLVSLSGEALVSGRYPLASASYPTSQWSPGEVLQRYCDLTLPTDVPAGEADLLLSLLDSSGEPLGTPLRLTSLVVAGRHYVRPQTPETQVARIGESIHLLGFGVEPTSAVRGGEVDVTLYWETSSRLSSDLTVFVHLIGPDGALRGQHDGKPMEGRHPTGNWRLDETIVDTHRLVLADDAPPGTYTLVIGMYDAANGGVRIPLYDDQGARQPDDGLVLGQSVQVKE